MDVYEITDKNLPIVELYDEFVQIKNSGKFDNWVVDSKSNICINTTVDSDPNDVGLGSQSLDYDWANSSTDDQGNLHLPKRTPPLLEKDFTVLCNQFRNTNFENVYNCLRDEYSIGRVRIMQSSPKTCLSWHYDTSHRIHYPMKTQTGCFMVFENNHYHLEKNTWYYTNTDKHHTAINSSFEIRYHLVVSVL
jgi:hypothetical protein